MLLASDSTCTPLADFVLQMLAFHGLRNNRLPDGQHSTCNYSGSAAKDNKRDRLM